MTEWQPIATAPRDRTEVILYYHDWGGEPLVVSGHWHCEEGREFEETWEHSLGYGDADMWQPMPEPPYSRMIEGELTAALEALIAPPKPVAPPPDTETAI